jgi:hypothetical protein
MERGLAGGIHPSALLNTTSKYRILKTMAVTSQKGKVMTALQVGIPYPTPPRKGCRVWNPDLLIEKLSMARLHD